MVERGGVQAYFLWLFDVQVPAGGFDRYDVGLTGLGEAQDDKRAGLPGMRTGAERDDLNGTIWMVVLPCSPDSARASSWPHMTAGPPTVRRMAPRPGSPTAAGGSAG